MQNGPRWCLRVGWRMEAKGDFQAIGIGNCGSGGPISCRRTMLGALAEMLRCPWGNPVVRSRGNEAT